MLITYVRSSSYNNYAYCQMQYFITYVLGHQSVSGKKAELGTIVHKVMECLAGLKKADQDGKTVKGQLAIKGTIDLVTKVDDKTIEVIDWKTGRRLDWATGEEKTYEKLCSDPQLLLYNYAISKLFPEYEQAIMSIFFIKDGGPFSMCFDQTDQARFLEMLKARFQEIQNNDSPKPISSDRSNWKCTKLCHFCKNDWPDTDQNMCIYIENHLKEQGMEETIKNCTRKGFDIGFYEAPG
jgi:hypothetical protein